MSKVESIKRSFPKLYKPDANQFIKALLEAIGEEDNRAVEQITNAKAQIFVSTAEGTFLDTLGSNVGVERPLGAFGGFATDDFYRQLIPLLSYAPKQIKDTMEDILFVFFGNDPDVFVEEVNPNEIVVQVPSILIIIRDQLEGATHFHSNGGDIVKIDNTLKQITVNFADERNLVENFDSIHDFSGSTDVSNIRLSQPHNEDTSIQSVAFDKSGATEAFGSITRDLHYSIDISDNEWLSVWCYVSDITNIDSARITLHTGANSSEYEVPDTDLQNGWNLLNIELSAPDMVNGTGADLTDVDALEFRINFDGTGFTLTDIRFDTLEGTPTVTNFVLDQFVDKTFSQHTNSAVITGSSAGKTNILLQFGGGEDLSVFDRDNKFDILNSQFTGDFVFYPQGPAFTVTSQRAVLDQNITNGDPGGIIAFQDSTDIPDSPGYLVFSYGEDNQEELVPYLERNSSTSLIIDPAYTFLNDHTSGELVQVVTNTAFEPDNDGHDMAIYNVGTEEPVEAAQNLLDLIKASGVVIRFIVKTV